MKRGKCQRLDNGKVSELGGISSLFSIVNKLFVQMIMILRKCDKLSENKWLENMKYMLIWN